jgi:hypothetical protein
MTPGRPSCLWLKIGRLRDRPLAARPDLDRLSLHGKGHYFGARRREI